MDDFESYLRHRLTFDAPEISPYLNDEGRVEIKFDDGRTFVFVGNQVVEPQPPAQRVAAAGFDSHEGMGSRK